MIILRESQPLNEMATACSKRDGYGMIIEVYSEDHGVLGNSSNPAHAHISDTSKKYLGKFAITRQPPRASRYVFDCDKNMPIPEEYKDKIVEWAKYRHSKDEDISNWGALKLFWGGLHP